MISEGSCDAEDWSNGHRKFRFAITFEIDSKCKTSVELARVLECYQDAYINTFIYVSVCVPALKKPNAATLKLAVTTIMLPTAAR